MDNIFRTGSHSNRLRQRILSFMKKIRILTMNPFFFMISCKTIPDIFLNLYFLQFRKLFS